MPRLGISVNPNFQERKAPPTDQYGRRVRTVNGIAQIDEKKPFVDPIFLKLAAGLAVFAAISMTIALWRLFTFPH